MINNNLGPDLKFIFENPSKSLNFLDTVIRVVETNLVLYQLKELKEHRKHPAHIIDYSFTKKLQSECQTENSDSNTFIRTYNSNHNIN